MQTRNSFFRACILLTFIATNGGLSRAQQSLTPALVDKIRTIGASKAEFLGLFFQRSSTPRAGTSLSLSYGTAEPEFRLKGVIGKNTTAFVPLSDVELITYLGEEGQYLKFRVVRYDISSKELLESKPNYTQLQEHLKTTEILIPARDEKGAALYWMGRTDPNNEVERFGKVDQTATNRTIRIILPITATWWAIPSVANDPLCPIKGLRPLGDSRGISKE